MFMILNTATIRLFYTVRVISRAFEATKLSSNQRVMPGLVIESTLLKLSIVS